MKGPPPHVLYSPLRPLGNIEHDMEVYETLLDSVPDGMR